jgi:hypothetical protein
MNNLGIVFFYVLFSINFCTLATEDALNMVEIPEEVSPPYAELPKDGTGNDLSTQFLPVEVVRKPIRRKKQTLDEKAQVTVLKREASLPKAPEQSLEAVTILPSVESPILPLAEVPTTPIVETTAPQPAELLPILPPAEVPSTSIEEATAPQPAELPILPIVEICTTTIVEDTAEKQLPAPVKTPSPPKQEKNQPTLLDRALTSTLQKMSLSTGSIPYLFFHKTAFPILGLPEPIFYQLMGHFKVTETKSLRLVCKQFEMYGRYSLLERGIRVQRRVAEETEPLMVNVVDKEVYVQNRLSFLNDYLLVETRSKVIDSICAVPAVKVREVCERILKVSGGKKMFSTELFDYLADLTMVPTPLWDQFHQMGDELYRQVICLLKFTPSPFQRAQIISLLRFVPSEFLPSIIQTTYEFYVSNTLENHHRMKSLMVLTAGLLESQKRKMGATFKSKRWCLTPKEIYSWALEWDHCFPDS